jgi:hypothetical protein
MKAATAALRERRTRHEHEDERHNCQERNERFRKDGFQHLGTSPPDTTGPPRPEQLV